ncbi:acetyltransferase AlgX (SGNH hydrolase-like protein) [Nitrospirillum amazonense]|uniref:Acetyltransferase AlgX (SGNH hydrolase-like protein) n=1 Tax=Nitrospirillum amazonense TaxID=28077 RepID=A0A560FSA5_9PROT|nr:hypothetical protein [Nitrospirillum amazonense]TWB24482.1 acetyltransferase AlgX (SGNH hydrolase-like protein) [Nitrospirillum amazonense]
MRRTFVILWVALLFVPMAQMIHPIVSEPPVLENRVLNRLPEMSRQALATPLLLTRGVAAWFNDNFGFRNTLIRLRTEENYRLGYSERLHLGPDGWLNYRDVIDTQKSWNAQMSDTQIAETADRFATLRDYLAKRGMRLLVVTVPQKDVIYPESLGSDAPHYPQPSAFTRLRAGLTVRLGSDHIDAEPILLGLRAKGVQAFHRTDFHWTDVAGGEVARAIVNRLANLEGDSNLRWTAPLTVEPLHWAGGESQQLPLFTYVYEDSVGIKEPWRDPARGTFEWLDVDSHFNPDYPLAYDFNWHLATDQHGLPATVVVSNSYGESFWRAGMNLHFDHLQAFRLKPWGDGAYLASVLNRIAAGTKYFVLEFHEGNMLDAGRVKWSEVTGQ